MTFNEWTQHIAGNLLLHQLRPLSPRGQQMMQEALGENWNTTENIRQAEDYADRHPGTRWWEQPPMDIPAPVAATAPWEEPL